MFVHFLALLLKFQLYLLEPSDCHLLHFLVTFSNQIALVQVASLGRPLGAPHEFTKLEEAISHLEAAANGGHVFSMFNLGLVHL